MSVGDSLSKFRARGRDNWDKGESSRRFDPRKPPVDTLSIRSRGSIVISN